MAVVPQPPARGAGMVLATLACGQFLMTLDSSVMNVSIATVAEDVGTDVTGIQTAITLYTLVMAAFMITGGRIGKIMGYKRAFALGCVIYGCGSLLTALAPTLVILLIGWSVLEGLGAALILPAIVALVATNFPRSQRPRAYGLVAAAGAIAVAVGPLVGGTLTTYASWRWVFAGEVVVVLAILALTRRLADLPPDRQTKLDLGGTGLCALGLGLIVYGVLHGGVWGFVNPKPTGPAWLGLSPVLWLVLAGGAVLLAFLSRERTRRDRGRPVLLDPAMLDNRVLRAGLTAFGFQYLLQAGLFFTVPLFLSVALGLSAVATGVRILPLSLALLVTAIGVPRFLPRASPRKVARVGFATLLAGLVTLAAALQSGAGAEIVTLPLVLAGLGIGSLASQLGAVTVSAEPDERSAEVGGLQNTMTNLGASIGTALAGAVLIGGLTASLLTGITGNPAVPPDLSAQAEVELSAGVPFLSDAQLEAALGAAGVPPETAAAVLAENEQARLAGLRAALGLLSLIALAALFCCRKLPDRPPTADAPAGSE
ncbi:MFS transporter [Catellatospora tritici]|uniref:MFS transporter n=1 Tax=Catellatospora tritici TaxID=2851566 RepID=UPI001C2DA3E3|nr:MFS transporter [Catellatospora tritici]MBV1850913.1 MFS transporter [Catellatospora tritici]MBV1851166.1 MFS transporter [Catellatospora tritici]